MKIMIRLFVLTLIPTLLLAACGVFEGDTSLEGTSWSLVEVNGQPVLAGSAPTLVFEADRAGGNGSCNTFGGEYKAENGKLSFGPIFSTLMYCEDFMDQESAYFAALEEASGYQIRGGKLQILNAEGQVTLTLASQN